MGPPVKANIFLTGFSGTGKSQVGREVARLLGWAFVDTDAEIVRRAGKPVYRIFAEEGEAFFRRMERDLLGELAARRQVVAATGGGMVVAPANRELMTSCGLVVCLEARPETIHQRLAAQGGNGEVRPLLAGSDSLERVRSLKGARQFFYSLADATVHTDALTVQEVAQEVVRAWDRLGTLSPAADARVAATVRTSQGDYPIYLGWGLLDQTAELLRERGLATTVYVIADEQVFRHHGPRLMEALERGGVQAREHLVPSGEGSKSLEAAALIYEWLTVQRAERRHTILALGGGVVGDLAGFVAATCLRGMPFVQAPTSLAAMVDASIGGKTAVNLPQGKNLVGAFHQPRLVVADLSCLATLPPRELASGWAEAIKHGLILDRGLFELFEQGAEQVRSLEGEEALEAIRRSIAIKAGVVSRDERETTGLRTLLNYGHTIGHALEAATGYRQYLHGEAVAIGMEGAARISQALGLLPPAAVERQRALLHRFGLPTACPDVDPGQLEQALAVDKKTEGKAIGWVLLEEIGLAVVRRDVPARLVRSVLEQLTG